jgi:hypothetical protein
MARWHGTCGGPGWAEGREDKGCLDVGTYLVRYPFAAEKTKPGEPKLLLAEAFVTVEHMFPSISEAVLILLLDTVGLRRPHFEIGN